MNITSFSERHGRKVDKVCLEVIYKADGTFDRFESVNPDEIFESKDKSVCEYVQVINGKPVQTFQKHEMYVGNS